MRRKLSTIEYLWSLAILVKDAWGWLAAAAFGVGSPMILSWRYIKMMAENVGWWVYPLTGSLFILATIGVFSISLIIRRKIKVLGNADIIAAKNLEFVKDLRNKAIELHRSIIEIIVDYRTLPPTHPDFHPTDESHDTSAWQRRNFDIRNNMFRKYMSKYHTPCLTLFNLAKPYSPTANHASKRFSWHFSEHDVEALPEALLKVAMDLNDTLIDLGELETHQSLLGIEEEKQR